jgi:hypothetical protein
MDSKVALMMAAVSFFEKLVHSQNIPERNNPYSHKHRAVERSQIFQNAHRP